MAQRAPAIFISAHELSGELHAAHLAEALQQYRAALGLAPAHLSGNGSQAMRAAGIELFSDVTHMGAIGIVNIAMQAPRQIALLRRTAEHILRRRPEMVIMVDSRGFHLRLAEMLRAGGYTGKLVYFIAPVLWESLFSAGQTLTGKKETRFLQVRDNFDLALLIYPVSLESYARYGVPHAFIGHPACELAQPQLSDDEFAELVGFEPGAQRILVGALVGSRTIEIGWLAATVYRGLALMREALAEDPSLPRLQVVSPVAHPDLRDPMLAAARAAGLHELTLIGSEYNYDLMARADLMVVKSGTSLHECTLMGAPAVMCYRVPHYLAFILRRFMNFGMPFYGLPNMLAGREIVPELIQEHCTELRIAEVAGDLLFSEQKRAAMLAGYAEIRAKLCPGGEQTPLQHGARLVQELLGGRR